MTRIRIAVVALLGLAAPPLVAVGDQSPFPLLGRDDSAAFEVMSDAELIDALSREDRRDRRRAGDELRRRDERVRPALLRLVADADRPVAARTAALSVVQSFWNDAVRDALLPRLDDKEPAMRRQTAGVLGKNVKSGDKATHDALLKSLGDPDPAARRAIALAMGQVGAPGAADALVNALAFNDSDDAGLRDGLLRAVERLGPAGVERLVALAESGGAEKDVEKVVEAFAALRTAPGAAALPGMLRNPHLSIAQRATLVRSYRNYRLDPPLSLTPLLDYLTMVPEAAPVKLAGLEVLTGSDALKSEKGLAWLEAQRDDTSPAVRDAAARALTAAKRMK